MSKAEPAPPPSADAGSDGSPRPGPLVFEGEMTIYRAFELKDAMLAALRRPDPIEVDLSRVTAIDSAGVQILLLGRQLATAWKKELRLTAPSPAVEEVLDFLHLRAPLGLARGENETASVAPPGAPGPS